MEKLEQIIPTAITVNGHQVIVPEKDYQVIIETINKQSTAINNIIDALEDLRNHLTICNNNINGLSGAVKSLASALKTFTEE